MTENAKAQAAPYEDLYIYYVEGRVPPDVTGLGGQFIGNWVEDDFSFLFFAEPSQNHVEQALCGREDLKLIDSYCMSYDEWQGERIKPYSAGGFFITPPWIKESPPGGANQIILDPGVVFGTGTHPTTHDCLEMIEYLFREKQIKTVLDLGTGTGLLALSAALLGARKVLAVDFNYLAVKTALKNIRLNGLEDKVLPIQARAEEMVHGDADLIVSNIHFDVMKSLVESKGFFSKKWFILSGLMRSQAREIQWRLSKCPVRILEKREQNGVWSTFFGEIY